MEKGFGLRSYSRNDTWSSDKPNLVANSLTLSTIRKSVLQELNLNIKPVFFGSSESYLDYVSKLWNKDKRRVILRPTCSLWLLCRHSQMCTHSAAKPQGSSSSIVWPDTQVAHGEMLENWLRFSSWSITGSMKTQDFVFLQIEITLRIVRLLLDKGLCFRTFLEVAC